MKLDLCVIFRVKEGQHFWIKSKNNKKLEEYYIKDNKIYNEIGYLIVYNILQVVEVYHKDPSLLQKNTKPFLQLINKKYKYLARDRDGSVTVYEKEPIRDHHSPAWFASDGDYFAIRAEMFDVDFSFVKWEEGPVLIEDVLGETVTE